MSSFRNAIRRRAHKERAQPHGREKFGLLEKKKDYKERAKAWHRKEDQINRLREKAAQRNPDEFYHRMISETTTDGVHILKRKSKHSQETVKKMKMQDLSYLRTKKLQEDKKIERLKDELHCLTNDPQLLSDHKKGVLGKRKQHVIFKDDQEELKNWDPATHFETAPELVGRAFNRPRITDLKEKPAIIGDVTKDSLKSLEKTQKRKYQELTARKDRRVSMNKMISKLERSRNLASKGKRTKIIVEDKFGEEDKSKTYYKWKMERKK